MTSDDTSRRKRIDCQGPCQRDDVPGSGDEWFRRIDYCHDCAESYDPTPMHADTDGESAGERYAAAWREKENLR